jgi:uncharacterized integral membrane protein
MTMETAVRDGGHRGAWHIFAGLFITAVGVIFLLANLGIWDIRYFFRWAWPIMLILVGIRQIVRGRADQ